MSSNHREPRTYGRRHALLRSGRWVTVVLLLTACGGGGTVQTSTTAHYTVQLGLNGVGSGERAATVQISDDAAQPATVDKVVIAPIMEQMGMATPEVIARPLSPGYYQARGDFFSMAGEWRIYVRISAGGTEEVARFTVQSA